MKKGFTLIEILVTISISTIIGWAMISVLRVADIVWYQGEALIDLQQQVRSAIDGMTRETRQAKPANILITNGGERVDFSIPSASGLISYYVANNQLIREHQPGASQVLAPNINTVSFCCMGGVAANCTDCANANIFRVGLSARKTVRGHAVSFPSSGTLTDQVRLRN